ncbi:MAG: CapA family protein, partial [Clostridia bacterium]|nr:CapA family protein [Clostridia bacterium]
MAKKKNRTKGIHIGGYTIRPMGIGVILALLVIIVVAVLAATNHLPDIERLQYAFVQPTEAPTPEPTATNTPVPATPTPVPTPSPTPEPREATIRVMGEISMDTDLLKSVYNRETSTFDFAPMFSLIEDVTSKADYTVADVEGVMTSTAINGEQAKMLTPPALLKALDNMGVDMLMLGNDHAMDGGADALRDEIANVEAAGFDYVGAASSIEDKVRPIIKNIKGYNVGFVAYTEKLNIEEKKISAGDLAGCLNMVNASNAISDVKALRSAGANIVIALVNWGELYSQEATESQTQIAQYLASNCGVDIILGYNPAVVQPVYWIENENAGEDIPEKTLVMSAAGNFISSQRDNGKNCGYIFEFTLKDEDGRINI